MYELEQVGEHTYIIKSPATIGLFVEYGAVTLIDSGNDKDAGRKINQHLAANGWELKTIVNTHSNADHIGGNAFLQQRTGCEIRGSGIENAFARFPVLEPSFLYGGYPPKPLRNKFLLAQPSLPAGDTSEGLPQGFEIISLPGHYFDMIGVRTPDDVVFVADCVMGTNILEKYHINFIYDVEQYLLTLDRVEELRAALFVPAHAEPQTDIRPLVRVNRNKVLEIIALLLELCKTPSTAEEISKLVFDHYGLTLDFNQYVLVGSTLRSYLAYLLDQGRVGTSFVENRLLWKTV